MTKEEIDAIANRVAEILWEKFKPLPFAQDMPSYYDSSGRPLEQDPDGILCYGTKPGSP